MRATSPRLLVAHERPCGETVSVQLESAPKVDHGLHMLLLEAVGAPSAHAGSNGFNEHFARV